MKTTPRPASNLVADGSATCPKMQLQMQMIDKKIDEGTKKAKSNVVTGTHKASHNQVATPKSATTKRAPTALRNIHGSLSVDRVDSSLAETQKHNRIDIYANPFFDLEAIADENEEEYMDEDMEHELALFLDDSETIDDSSSDLFGSFVGLDEPSEDEEEIAREIRQRYTERTDSLPSGDAVRGEALFSLGVKPNREKDAVTELQRIIAHRRKNLKPITISSVASYEQYPGQVFVWAIGAQELRRIAATKSYMLHWKITLIEQEEWLRLYAALDDHFRIPVPSWIRIKAGLYKGDLALLERSYSNEYCDILLIPRAFLVGRKRPKPALFTLEIATQYWGPSSIESNPCQPDWFVAKKMEIKAGLLCRYVSCHSFTPSLPKDLDELTPFMGAVPMLGSPDLLGFIFKTMDDIKANDLITVFRVGDRVRVVAGTFSSMEGIVRALEDNHASVSLTSSLPDVHVPPLTIIPTSDLRRVFKEGDVIRVISGYEQGRKGHIVQVDGPVLTFLDIGNRWQTEVVHSSSERSDRPLTQVSVYSFEVEFYSIEIKQDRGSTSEPEDIEFPETIGQRVEISAGIFKGCRGYIEGWDAAGSKLYPHIVVNLYFKPSPQCPTLESQSHNPIASLGRIRVPPNTIRRCFVNGDIVIRSGIPHTRFIVHPRNDGEDNEDQSGSTAPLTIQPIDGDEIPLVKAVFDPSQKEWVLPTGDLSWSMVSRRELMMTETIHDPVLAIEAGHVWFKENMTVIVIKGSRKGYRGRVRKVLRTDVQVELEATQKVHKYKPKQLARVIDNYLFCHPPTPDASPVVDLPDVEPAPHFLFDPVDVLTGFMSGATPMPTPLVDHPEPAWDPVSRTPRRRVEYDLWGSLFLLHLPFASLYDQIGLMFFVRGTQDNFMNGRYEGNLVRTAPANKRPGTIPQHGDIFVYMTYRPSSLTAIHCRYLIPAHPGPGDVGALLFSADAGRLVDVTDRKFDDPNQVLVRTREDPPREFKLDVCDMIRVWK